MTEPNWVALGPGNGVIDFVGGWSAAVNYLPGNIVRYNGVDYLAVNPSVGQPPPAVPNLSSSIGTSFPVSPTDGQEFTLVDSLTAPTYAWRFRYLASIADVYKWVFIGGSPAQKQLDPNVVGTALTQIATSGYYYHPASSFVLPRDGLYSVEYSAVVDHNGDGNTVNIAIGIGNLVPFAVSARPALWSGNVGWFVAAHTQAFMTGAQVAGTLIAGVITIGAGNKKLRNNILSLTPVRVS